MKKRLVSLLVLTIVLTLATAPIAMADHCKRCLNNACTFAITGGKLSCAIIAGTCTTSGTCGGPHPRVEEPLAVDYFVASVERLDEARPASTETRVASLETKPSAKR